MSKRYILTGHWGPGDTDDTVDDPATLEYVFDVIRDVLTSDYPNACKRVSIEKVDVPDGLTE